MRRRFHRNSQKRIYIPGASYFVTTVTKDRYLFFAEPILCELFISNLRYAAVLKQFIIHGYVLLPDHVHLLITPYGSANISAIMHNIKRNFSHNANIVMGFTPESRDNASEDYYNKLPNWEFIKQLSYQFHQNYANPLLSFPVFGWQHSFHDHYIRDEKDFNLHAHYIYMNAVQHGLVRRPEEYLWMWCERVETGLKTTVE